MTITSVFTWLTDEDAATIDGSKVLIIADLINCDVNGGDSIHLNVVYTDSTVRLHLDTDRQTDRQESEVCWMDGWIDEWMDG